VYLNSVITGYKLARFVFSVSFLVSYFVYLSIGKVNLINFPLTILIIYSLISFVLAFYKNIDLTEFLLDIVFISVFIISNFESIYYLSLLYLFPIFFYGMLSGKNITYILSGLSLTIYVLIRFIFSHDKLYDLLLPSFLHGFSFFIIAFAGISLNKRLKKQQEEISKLEEEKKKNEIYKKLYEISANVAHEIKNPLASISGAAQLLKEKKYDENLIDIIYKETKRVDNLLKDFLNLSHTYQGEEKLINLKDFIEEIVNLYKNEKNFQIDVENITVKVNEKALRSIVENLIKNAVYWSKNTVSVKLKKEKNKIKITVEDDGSGIKPEIKEKIYDPFFTTRHDGTGLGLAIAKNTAINIGGNIFATKSENLGGAKFIVEVPVKDESTDYR
jgi:signal transduction histidine kinase